MLILFLLAVLAGAPVFGEQAQDTWAGVERVVAVGDVHGDYNAFVEVLRSAGVIDGKSKWAGGATHLVQTGDMLDRGSESRKVMDLLMELEKQASKAGGRVHVLLGNHEAMNVYGDLRYVSAKDFSAYRSADAGYLRQALWEQESRRGGVTDRRSWEQEHPLGWVEHRLAFAETGVYGKWLRSRPAMVKINDTVYLHGGISPGFADRSMAQINEQVAAELKDFTKLTPESAIVSDDGPLWYRGLAKDPEEALAAHLDAVLGKYGASRMVIAHTPTPGAVIPRFGGKLLIIDVGLSAHFGSRRACLVLEREQAYAIHRGERIALPGADRMEMVRYLRAAIALEPSDGLLSVFLRQVQGGAQD